MVSSGEAFALADVDRSIVDGISVTIILKVALIQVLDGADGAKAQDDFWPAFHKSDVHASPIMVDFDYDGVLDILVATSDGELLVIKDTVRPSPTQPQDPCPGMM